MRTLIFYFLAAGREKKHAVNFVSSLFLD
jgi:hypothetical protein